MGRYYKTTDGNQLDFMYQLPKEMMIQAVQTADAANDQIYNQTDLLGNALAKINHLSPDNERVAAIQSEYQAKIDETTKALQADPTNYRKQMPLVRSLTRDLTTNMQSGELSAIMSNASKMAEWDKTYQPLVASGKITPDAYQAIRNKTLSDFKGTGYDKNTATGTVISPESIYQTQDFNKILKDNIGTIKSNAEGHKFDSIDKSEKWLVTNGGKKEWVTAARVAQIASDTLLGDQNVVGYLKQGGKYGYLKGVFDQNGDFINPYTLDKSGNPVFNNNSILANPVRSLVGQEAFTKSEKESSMKVNDYTKQRVDFENDIAKINWNDKIHDENFRDEAEIKWKYDEKGIRLKDALGDENRLNAAKLNGTVKATDKKTEAIKNSQPRIQSSSDGVTAVLPFGGDKALTSEKIQGALDVAKEDVVNLLAMAKNPNISPNQRAVYQQRADEMRASFERNSDLATKAQTYTNSELKKQGFTQGELENLETYRRLKPNLQKRASELANKIEELTPSTSGRGSAMPVNNSPEYQKLKDDLSSINQQLKKYGNIEKAADRATSKWFTENSDKSAFKVDGVGLSAPQKMLIYGQIKSDPESFVFHDLNTDEIRDGVKLSDAFKAGNGIDMIDIQTINPPVPGIGTTVTAKLKDQAGNPSGDSFLITIPNKIQSILGNNLSKGTQENQKKLGATLQDKTKVDFLSSIKNKVSDRVSSSETQPAGFYSQYDPVNDYTAQIKVVPQTDRANPQGNPVSYKTYVSLKDGSYVELPLPVKGPNGTVIPTSEFANEEAIADAYSAFIHK